ncbi:MAG: formimidoylglutamate deiminase [Paracoccaceae bacterium]
MQTTIWAETALLPEGWADGVRVGIASGRIAEVAPAAPAPAPDDIRVGALLPAPGNLHSHAFQRAMAGLTEHRTSAADSFWTWRDLMYRFVARLEPEDVEAIAAQVFVEMLEAGFAAVGEFHYLHNTPDGAAYAEPAELSARIAAAAAETGIGLTHLPVLYMTGGIDGRPLAGGQQRFGADLEGFRRIVEGAAEALRPLADARLGVAPHSLRAVPAEALGQAAALRPCDPVHIHVAEQRAEVEEIAQATGRRPVERLLEIAPVDARWCLIHATQMTPEETRALAVSGAVAGLCPITEANLGDGIFDGARYLAAGGRFGIGSDANLRIGLAEELRQLEHSQRLRDGARAVLSDGVRSVGRTLFDGAVSGGAQALGRDAGAIAPGRLADLVALARGGLALDGLAGDGLLDAWIFAGDDRLVDRVWSAGRPVVRDGRHRARTGVEARFRRVMARLRGAL